MALKTKRINTPDTQKKGGKVKNRRRTQPPPPLPNPQLEVLGLDDKEPNLRDVMKMLGSITTKLDAHDVRMDNIASHVVIPGAMADVQPGHSHDATKGDYHRVAVPDYQDQFHGMEEQVHRRVVECLRGALPAYLPTTYDNS